MSDDVLSSIPLEPCFVPGRAAGEVAAERLLSIWNPNVPRPLGQDAVAELEGIVGCKLLQVWARI